MNNKIELSLVPELRFPEFQNKENWHLRSFSKMFEIGGGKDHKHLASGDIPVYGSGGYMRSVNDYLYNGESACIGRKGTINKPIFLTEKFWTVDTLFYTHSFKNCLPKFVFSIFQNINWLNYNEAGAVPSLSKVIINKIEVGVPPNIKEQQKIADCLSSLDDLVSAHNKKLETLKNHKKGLMQQLFPAEGETIPKLRFPEFQEKWEECLFGEIIKINSGKGFKASEYSSSGTRLLQIENVGYGSTKWNENTIYLPDSYKEDFPELVLRKDDIVLALNRPVTNDELKIVLIKKDDEPSILYQRVGKLEILNNAMVVNFTFQLCNDFVKEFVINKSIGSDQPFIALRDLYTQKIRIPLIIEQQKIADCLSSLDDLIAAQSKKIEALKSHKKGLMQQLFPAVNEIIL